MYAVIATGGKQYRVAPGQILKIERLAQDAGEVKFEQVLMFANGEKIDVGSPFVAGASVKATILDQGRHKKVRIIKFRRRKHFDKMMGHRQDYTRVQITDIVKN